MPSFIFFKLLQSVFRIGGRWAPTIIARFAFRLFCTPFARPVPSHPVELALLDRAEKLWIPFGSGKIAVYRWFPPQDRDNGKSVLFLHGWSSYAFRFRQFVEPFVESGYTVVLMDAPAHGKSTGKRTHLINYAKSILAVADNTGIPYAIVGHSFGGLAASFVVSGHAPLPAGLNARRIVTIGTPDSVKSIVERFSDYLKVPENVLRELYEHMEHLTGESMDVFSTGYFTRFSGVPTLVVHDTDDRVVSLSDAQKICETAKNASLLVTRGLGHRRILWNEEVVRSSLAFIENGFDAADVFSATEIDTQQDHA